MSADNPNPYVYEIEQPEKDVARVFSGQMAVLHELCTYGSNLLVRCYNNRDNKLEDHVLLACLLRQFLVHLDATQLLLNKGSVLGSHLHLRAMLEEQIYIKWLVKSDTTTRAKYFYVSNLRKRRAWTQTLDPTTPEAQNFETALGSGLSHIVSDLRAKTPQTEVSQQVAAIDSALASPEFAAINAQFTATRGNKPYEPDWYKPYGINSVSQVAAAVDMTPQYKVCYGKWSEAMHSSGLFDHAHVDEDGVSIEQIRSLVGISDSIRMAASMAHDVFDMMIQRYRPGETTAFNLKYWNEWRERIMNIPQITINRETRKS